MHRPMKLVHRRQVLRGAGSGIALPLLSAMTPIGNAGPNEQQQPVARTVAICGGLGFHAPLLFPEQTGRDYPLTPYLKLIEQHRSDYTLFSGLSHPEQNGNNGHASGMTWLTSARRPGLAGFRNSISLDQLIASQLSGSTRLPFLALSNDGTSLSWTANGINIPSESSPARLFKTLFVDGSSQEIAAQMRDLRRGLSILDTVQADARKLNRTLGNRDRAKLDEYLTAIRDLEQRIGQSESWTVRPKPEVDIEPPQDVADKQDIIARQRLMYDMILLALQTDSTRAITLSLGSMNAVPSNIHGVRTDWHNLSHHGRDESRIAELRLIEEAEFQEFNRFLNGLKAVEEQDRTLLDNTAVLFGSNLGNASSHDWHNLPIILAGGGYRHGSYVAHNADDNTPLANLFVSLAQRMGIETESFGSSTAAGIHGLESA